MNSKEISNSDSLSGSEHSPPCYNSREKLFLTVFMKPFESAFYRLSLLETVFTVFLKRFRNDQGYTKSFKNKIASL